ncbi:hypothetical protein vseg_004561 [Gypsophila vaccaria]
MAHFKFHLTLIFVLLAWGIMESEAQCVDGLGECGPGDEQCQRRCKEKHPSDGEGRCDEYGLCSCYYACSPPPPALPSGPKTCTSNDGVCDHDCTDDSCCTARCKTKWPGATGSCQQPIATAPFLCLCSFSC